MALNYEKPFGWILLFAGLVLIVYSVKTTYGYFTGDSQFPVLIETPLATQQQNSGEATNSNADLTDPKQVQAMMQVQIQGSIDKTLAGMIPAGAFAKMLNAALWSLFATFLVYTGAKISEVGAKLIAIKQETN